MLLKRIKIEKFKGIEGALELGPFSQGFNIIYGPNGTGKSTILDALAQGLFSRYKSSGKNLNELRPWGRSLAPTVELEFTKAGHDYRLRRQLVDSPGLTLDIFDQGHWRPLDDAARAEERLRELWGADPAAKVRGGVAGIEDWGWGRLLWVPQGLLPLSGLPGESRDILSKLLGAGSAAPGQAEFETRLLNRYNEYFTEKGQERKKGGQSVLEKLQNEFFETKTRYELANENDLKAEAARETARQAQDSLKIIGSKIVSLAERLAEVEKNLKSRHFLEKQLSDLRLSIGEINEKASRFKEKHELLIKKESDRQKTLEEIAKLDLESKTHELDFKKIKTEGRNLVKQLNQAKLSELTRQETKLAGRFLEVQRATRELEEIKAARQELQAPSLKEFEIYKKAQNNLKQAEAALKAAEMVLTLDFPGREIKAVLGRLEKTPAGEIEIRGLAEVSAEIEGLGTVRSAVRTQEADSLKKNLVQAENAWNEAARRWGENPQAVAELVSGDQDLEQRQKETEARARALLEVKSLSALEQQLAEIKNKKTELTAKLGIDNENESSGISAPPEMLETQLDKARKEAGLKQTKLEVCRRELYLRQNALKNLMEEIQKLNLELGPFDEASRRQEERLLSLESKRLEGDRLAKQLNGLPDLSGQAKALAGQINELTLEEKKDEQILNESLGYLKSLGEQGFFNKYQEIKGRLFFLEKEISARTRTQEAVKLLYQTYQEERKAFTEGPAKLLAPRVENIYKRLIGPKFKDISLADEFSGLSLLPADLPPGSQLVPVTPNHLSAGERDLLYLSVRLAAADVLSQEEPQLLLLDDVITNCDSRGLKRLLAELNALSSKAQIILFTCHEDRLPPLPQASFFNLAELLSQGSL